MKKGFKFYVLRNLGNSYFASYGTGQCVSSQREENLLAVSVMNLISNLLNFGFQSSLPKLVELTPVRGSKLCCFMLPQASLLTGSRCDSFVSKTRLGSVRYVTVLRGKLTTNPWVVYVA